MAGFDREFRKAYERVVGLEKERARMLKALAQRIGSRPTYRDLISDLGDELDLRELASDCSASAEAFEQLAYLATEMGKAMTRQERELEQHADVLG